MEGRTESKEYRRVQECLAALFAAAGEREIEDDPAGLETYGEGVERVSRVPVRDNGEPLVLVADPSIAPPPHSTGGAIDVMLVDEQGRRLDMSSPLPSSEISAPTSCAGLSAEARANRALLVESLTRAGLTNYPGEWWHWSY